MHSLVRRVHDDIRRQALITAGERVALAVSGGSDSVALLFILAELSRKARWELVGVIHVNHQIRPESDADERFVVALAKELSLPVEAMSVNVPQRVAASRRSLEVTAREARYECFERAAGRLGATTVATGHTVDDQAETVLLRLLRGTGARGLGAIRARRGMYVRPLLGCQRSELRSYLAMHGRMYCEDPSNASLSVPRNRIRHQLLPLVLSLAPGGVRAVARFATLAVDDEQLLTELAEQASGSAVQLTGDGVQLDVGLLLRLPRALARRVIRSGIERSGGVANAFDIEAVLRFAHRKRPTGGLDLHRVTVVRTGSVLTIGHRRTVSKRGGYDGPEMRSEVGTLLPIPGRADLKETGVCVSASFLSGTDAGLWSHGGLTDRRVALQADAVRLPLVVRHREPGDRFHPLGAPGSRRLQDVMVDRKVPRSERDKVPLVVDDSGRIVWVAGVGIAHHCRVTAPEAGMVILELEEKDSQ
jgi:tRNA(Ile)-lysidine synthase